MRMLLHHHNEMQIRRTLLSRIFYHRRHLLLLTEAPTPKPCHRTPKIPPQTPKNRIALTYLEGHPIPDPKYAETILGIPRDDSGKSIAAKLRKVGQTAAIVFEQADGQHGGNKRLISVQIKQIKKLVNHMGQSFFCSRLFNLEVRPDLESDEIIEKVRVLPRMLHFHPTTDIVLNVTFLRAPSDALIKIDVPLVFIGEDASPGLKKGAFLNTIKKSVKYLCPADIIPPYIEVDLSELDVGKKILMGDLKVHPALKLLKPKEEPVCKIVGSRASGKRGGTKEKEI